MGLTQTGRRVRSEPPAQHRCIEVGAGRAGAVDGELQFGADAPWRAGLEADAADVFPGLAGVQDPRADVPDGTDKIHKIPRCSWSPVRRYPEIGGDGSHRRITDV